MFLYKMLVGDVLCVKARKKNGDKVFVKSSRKELTQTQLDTQD